FIPLFRRRHARRRRTALHARSFARALRTARLCDPRLSIPQGARAPVRDGADGVGVTRGGRSGADRRRGEHLAPLIACALLAWTCISGAVSPDVPARDAEPPALRLPQGVRPTRY